MKSSPAAWAGCISCMLADYSGAVNPPTPYLALPRRVGPARLSRLGHGRLLPVDDDGALRLQIVILASDEENRRVSGLQGKLGGEFEGGRAAAHVTGLAGGLEEHLAVIVFVLDEYLQIAHPVRVGCLPVQREAIAVDLDAAVAGIEIGHPDARRLARLHSRDLGERRMCARRFLHERRGDEARA